jgi:hypothetical protein
VFTNKPSAMCFYCKNGKQNNKTPSRLNILIIQSTIRSKSDTQSIQYMTDHLPKKSGMANLILKDRTPSLSALVFKAIFKLFFYVFD